ncbi:MAG: flagellar motor switch phosphatase FliY [Lachnospiraceae bacterium]|nr:flagellar motor switch phosphatase FliY [Lachnospiraceae bacterium]
MDAMLSQDEINALLSGMDPSDSGSASVSEPAPAPAPSASGFAAGVAASEGQELDEVERDAVGEVANISMGSSATTLYSLVNRKVNITTPVVSMVDWESVIEDYQKPCVFIQIHYTAGLDGTNILVLRENDVKIITDLMMGGDGTNTDGELGELHLSAISEAMNQMMGASATSLSTMLGTMIDISPPDASLIDLTEFKSGSDIAPFLGGTFVKVSFMMQIGDLVDSTIMQLYPIEFAKRLVQHFIESSMGSPEPEPEPAPAPMQEPTPMAQPEPTPAPNMSQQPMMGDMSAMNMGMPQMGMGQPMMGMGMPQMGMGMPMMNMGMPQMNMGMQPMQNVNIQPAQFQNFGGNYNPVQGNENIGLIMDVPLEVTVELGRTSKSISEILDFSPGTIIELDKIAGEPIDILVNGKFVAKGEVVVLEESFAVRVTEIIK